ncbi:MAG: ester cyclase [Vulcanimicrobiaceae bacterium]
MTPDFFDHDGPGGKPTGIEGDEQMMLSMYRSMPDLHIAVEEMLADGDKVVCRNVWRWIDISSGKKMEFHGFVLWRFEGDKIAERWAGHPSGGGSFGDLAARDGAQGVSAIVGATSDAQRPVPSLSIYPRATLRGLFYRG